VTRLAASHARASVRLPLVAAVVLIAIWPGSGSVAQITTNTALPVGKGQTILRFQSKLLRKTVNDIPEGPEVDVFAVPIVVVHGPTAKLALFAVVPYFNKSLDMPTQGGRVSRSTSGIGDVRTFARFEIYRQSDRGKTTRVAPFAGIDIPTGSTDAADDLGTLPRPLQLGTGSWNPFAGVVVSRQTFDWQVDASVSYQRKMEANDFRFGDVARLDVASKVRILPRSLGSGMPSFVFANLETNLIYEDKSEAGGVEQTNSGGTTWFLAPGLQYASVRTIVEAAIQVPVVYKPNGSAPGTDYIVTLSIRYRI